MYKICFCLVKKFKKAELQKTDQKIAFFKADKRFMDREYPGPSFSGSLKTAGRVTDSSSDDADCSPLKSSGTYRIYCIIFVYSFSTFSFIF